MGTKNDPGEFDCYANAEPDEPIFVLLARDPLAPDLVEAWAGQRVASRGLGAKVPEAIACAAAMREWRQEKRRAAHVADQFDEEAIRGLLVTRGFPLRVADELTDAIMGIRHALPSPEEE